MKKFFFALAGVAMLAGSAVVVSEPAMASPSQHRYQHNFHKHPHRKVCRTVVRKKVVWRHHRRHVVRYKTRICNWR